VPDVLTGSGSRWIILIAAIVVLLVIDLVIMRGRGGHMTVRSAAIASAVWIGISLLAFGVLFLFDDREDASNFLAGYLVEKSLSLDNVFVFLVVFTAFGVAEDARHRLLTYGIVLALVLRAGFIVAGAAVLGAVGFMSYLFAALLIWTGWRMYRGRHEHDEGGKLVERLQRRFPIADGDEDTQHLTVRRDGRRMLTVGGAALASIAIVDVLFAVDSVPAILAITDDEFVVFAANAFALLGLRPLFFLIADLVERLYYLKTALAAVLVFVGIKLVYGEVIGKMGPEVSLPIILGILGAGVVASLVRDRRAAASSRRGAAGPPAATRAS
jgi:tellurite resistance protein TerC